MPAPSAAQIEDALAGRHGAVRLSYRFQQRDVHFNFQADLSAAFTDAAIELDNDRAVVRTAQFTIDAEEMPVGFDPSLDNVAVIALLEVPVYDAGASPPGWYPEQVEIPMGLYRLDVPEREFNPNEHQTWRVAASAIEGQLLTAKTPTPYTVPSGTNYLTAVGQLIALLGFDYTFASIADTTPVAFTWAPGTPYLQIINDLLFGVNWYPLYSTGTGVLTSRERTTISSETATATYSTEAEPRMVASPFQKSIDRTRWANRIASVIDDPRRAASYALRINNDPDSPISVAALTPTGSLPVINTDSESPLSGGRVVDATTNDEIVQFELRDRNARAQPGTLRTFPDPRRGPHEFYSVTIENEEVSQLWRCESWNLNLANGSLMEHKIDRAQEVDLSIIVALSGTITAATEAQIVAGGRTIILTLPTGYSWVASGATFDAQRAGILAGLVSLGAEAGGWNATVSPALVVTNCVRTSASIVTITLPAVAGYSITVPETVIATVPVTAITGSPANYTEPTFTITPS